MLAQVKRSPAYRQVRRRLPSPEPTDAWEVDGIAYFAWDLWPEEAAEGAARPPSTALFMVHVAARRLVAATIITPSPSGGDPEVVDLPVAVAAASAETGTALAGGA